MPGGFYGYRNEMGNYERRLPLAKTPRTFNIHALTNIDPGVQSSIVCPPSQNHTVVIDTIPNTLSQKDFGYQITPCHNLKIQIASNRRRRCFVNNTSLTYYNIGILPAPDAYILVEFPNGLRPRNVSQAHIALNDSAWRFNLGNLAPGAFGGIQIQDSVLCGNVGILNLMQCKRATIFPARDCLVPAGYNGADLTASGICVNRIAYLWVHNKGTGNMRDSTSYQVYLDSILVKSGKIKLAADDSLKLQVNPQGMGVHLVAAQVANHPSSSFVSATLENCVVTFPIHSWL